MKFAVDFDGTVVEHQYPAIGQAVPLAVETILLLQEQGHEVMLWTMRSGPELQAAVDWLKERGIVMHCVNANPKDRSWTTSPKLYAQVYIDDAAFGCPLIHPEDGGRPYVDWAPIRDWVTFELR